MNERITKLKVITGFKKEDFENEVNEFKADNVVCEIEYDTVVKKHKDVELVMYAAYITYLEKGDEDNA